MNHYDYIDIQKGNGKYRLQVDKTSILSPRIIDIYCNETPSSITSTLHKVGSICLVDEGINIFPHNNSFINSSVVYELIKSNIKEIMSV